MSKKKREATSETYEHIFDFFTANIMPLDCGQKCGEKFDGEPVCCDTQVAVPIMQKSEWKLLKKRTKKTKLWRKFTPYDAATREIVDELSESCKAVECKGARHCERDNRSLACRTFPFFPYFTKEGEILGLSFYWYFEDRCWVISNMARVEQDFIDQFLRAYAVLFEDDPDERQVFVDYSATMRRVFSRWKRPIPVIGSGKEYYMVLPKGGGIKTVTAKDMPAFAPFDD